ncbi:AGE family epimerase/isomerase [Flavitalea sp.]|nr:AGE family epimerase/isomerase [Flavitalea sp.]
MPDSAILDTYALEVKTELDSILGYWMKNMPDEQYGGYIGRIKDDNSRDIKSEKGSVLNSRILWTFSAAYNHTGEGQYLEYADRAYRYFVEHFIDQVYGGVYWTLDQNGSPADSKKQIYAQAFAIYGLSEYYKCDPLPEILSAAINIFQLIENHSFDKEHGGYIEDFGRDWNQVNELSLGDKDPNKKKSMNTHLHLVEAYANLLMVWPDEKLRICLVQLMNNFADHIINKETGHLNLFFDEEWNLKSSVVSFGHDVEAAWLLQEAAHFTGEEDLVEKFQQVSISLATAAARGLDDDGGLWYEKDGDHLVREKHWWPQAEAMVGFFNTWQITNDDSFFERSLGSWRFVKTNLLDSHAGEWHWGVDEQNQPMIGQDKAGIWKCPYRNGRACMEILNRITTMGLSTD